MRISVALCTYNGERFLRKQLDSILAQTRIPDEIVICDDGSTDSTVEILGEYQDRDTRIRVVRNSRNLGYRKNFEKAIGLTTGEWIFLSDQDDLWLPQKVAAYLQRIEMADGHLGLLFGNAAIVDDQGRPLGADLFHLVMKGKLLNRDQRISAARGARIFFAGNIMTGATMAIRRALVDHAVPFPEQFVHDHWLGLVCGVSGYKLSYVAQAMTLYRKHEGQAVSVALHQDRGRSQTLDSGVLKKDLVVVDRFRDLQTEGLRAALLPYWNRIRGYYHLRLRLWILTKPRTQRLKWVLSYWLSGRYSWVVRRPRWAFGILYGIYDCLQKSR